MNIAKLKHNSIKDPKIILEFKMPVFALKTKHTKNPQTKQQTNPLTYHISIQK